jgi:2-polyprenyl-3-methyl-5-hydroxy-6-metoxy-1,4-benzoquinol methylase
MIARILMALALLASTASLAADRPSLAPEVTAFLAWYDAYTGPINPMEVLKSYQAKLAGEGVSDTESKRQVEAIQAAIKTMPVEFTAVHFNKIYGMANPLFTQEPSQFLARIAGDLKPGTALDVGMGQGRNALYLASKGWNVTGYDVSPRGMHLAAEAARKAGLKLDIVKATHDEFDYGTTRWDLIVQTFAFTNLNDAAYRKRVIDSLKPGGVLLIEGFGGGGEKNLMINAFKELRVIYYEDRTDVADWGMQKARLTRIAVQKD